MRRREKQRAKHNREELEEAERNGSDVDKSSKFVFAVSGSDDDEEANEDLSLKIVEKALLMRAAKLVPDSDGPVEQNGLLDLPHSSSQEVEVLPGPTRVAASETGDLQSKKIIKRVRKKKTNKMEIEDAAVSILLFAFVLFINL